jgi:hypothetical protein
MFALFAGFTLSQLRPTIKEHCERVSGIRRCMSDLCPTVGYNTQLGGTLLVSPMSIILGFMLVLMPTASHLGQCPAFTGQTKENSSVSIKDLRDAPTIVVLNHESLSLWTYPWRDFMPGPTQGADGSPLMVVLRLANADKKPIPTGVRMDRAWVLFGDEVWEASSLRQRMFGQAPPKEGWINCSDLSVCETTIRGGPKWGPRVSVDVVVLLTDRDGNHHFLRAPKQNVEASW